ncbi:hypothetical protein PF008_g29117, partial [Phytophthora fragariae]
TAFNELLDRFADFYSIHWKFYN